jgi:hypothetical protein
MMLDERAQYSTLNHHINSTIDEMVSIGNFNINAITADLSIWKKNQTKILDKTLENTLE